MPLPPLSRLPAGCRVDIFASRPLPPLVRCQRPCRRPLLLFLGRSIHSIDVVAVVIFVTAAAAAATAAATAVTDITDVIAPEDLAIAGKHGQGDREGERRSFRHGCDVTRKCGEV
jgi:hypothetical protein